MKPVATLAAAAALLLAAGAGALAQMPVSGAPSPEKLRLAKAIVEASGGQAQAANVVKVMMGTMSQGLQKTMPPAQARMMGQLQADMQAEIVGMVPALIEVSERLYAQDFTEKELRDELAWVTSESGQSIRQKTPLLMQQLVQAEVPMIQAMMPAMSKRVIDRVCAEAQCSASDRQVIADAMAKAVAGHVS